MRTPQALNIFITYIKKNYHCKHSWLNFLLITTGTHKVPIKFSHSITGGLFKIEYLNPKQARGGGIRPQASSSLCCAETVSSRKLKLCDFYYIIIGLNSECKPVPLDIYCCHGNAIVEGCSVKFWQKSIEKCNFSSNRFLISI